MCVKAGHGNPGRIRQVRPPQTDASNTVGLSLKTLIAAGVVAWLVVFATLRFAFAGSLLPVTGDRAELLVDDEFWPNCVEALVGPLLIYLVNQVVRQIRWLKCDPVVQLRESRLARVTALPDAARRIPHRLIEQAYPADLYAAAGADPSPKKALMDILPRIAPGEVIVTNIPADSGRIWPIPVDRAFEPINANDAGQLVAWNLQSQGYDTDAALFDTKSAAFVSRVERRASSCHMQPAPDRPRQPRWARLLRGLGRPSAMLSVRVLYAVALTAFVLSLYRGFAGDILALTPVILLIASLVLAFAIQRMLVGQSCWLVPGGVALVRYPLWRKQARVRYFQSSRTPLVFDVDNQVALVLDGESVQHFAANWATLAAWMSSARSPSLEQVRTFLDGQR